MAKRKSDMNKIILLVVSSVFISIIIAEAILRLVDYSYTPLKIEVKGNSNEWRFQYSFKERHFIYDPNLIWRPKTTKKHSIFNSQGYVGKELPMKKNDDEFRIFAIGDSNTLGWFGKDGPFNWPLYLQELLTNRDKTFSVLNAGVWGYSSYQGEKRFEESLFLKPDMVLISFGANDAHMLAVSDAEFIKTTLSSYKPFLSKFKIGQVIIAFLEKVVSSKKESGKDELVHRVSVEEYKENLIKIIEISKKNNIECILLTRPFIGKSPNKLWWKNFAPDYVKATIEVGKNHGVPVVDIYSYFKDKDQYFADESHFNEDGHRLAAKIIYDHIKPLLLNKS
jgi:lysophospholipase L1-like esterase